MSIDVAFLGLGTMGSRQAAVLSRHGFSVTVWNRTAAKAQDWVAQHGGRAAATPAQAARGADLVVSMVVDGSQVKEVLLGQEGAADGAEPGALFVDMSTIAPAEARAIDGSLRQRGFAFLDAPVSGSAGKAADGTLTIMVGGDSVDTQRARPVLEAMGERFIHAGPVGHGQAIKLIHNAVAAVNLATVAQALVAGRRMGLDIDALVEGLRSGAANSTMLERKGDAMLAHDFDPLFKLDHMLKDLRYCLDEAAAATSPFPMASMACDLYTAASAQGLGERDFAAILESMETLADTRV